MKSVVIVLVNWNQMDLIRQRLREISTWKNIDADVVVVDNDSRGRESEKLRREFPRTTILESRTNLGFGGAHNLALNHLEANFVLLLNSDASIDEQSVERLIQCIDRQPDVAILGPSIQHQSSSGQTTVTAGGRDIGRFVRTYYDLVELPKPEVESDGVSVHYVPGTVALIRRSVLTELNGFEEKYFFGVELADFCERAKQAGYLVRVLPSIRAHHDAGRSSDLRQNLYPYYILRNRFLFVRKFSTGLPMLVRLGGWLGYGLAAILRACLRGNFKQSQILCLALADGIANRTGDQNDRVLRVDIEP